MKKQILSLSKLILIVMFLAVYPAIVHAQDPLEVGPDVYKKVFENERVRVMEVDFKLGGSIKMHSHPDHFVYVLLGGKLELTYPDGTNKTIEGKPGEVFWIPAESHATRNIGDSEFKALVVELKTS